MIDCPGRSEAIQTAIGAALTLDCSGVVNPYGDGHASEQIASILKTVGEPRALLRKRFHDMPMGV